MAKIIIVSCKGHGGHMSAAQAIMEALGEHSVHIIDFLADSLVSQDPFFWLTKGLFTSQDCYNFLLARNYKRLINILYYIGYVVSWLKSAHIQNAYQTLLNNYQPDICISVIPLFNGMFSLVAKKNKIPLIIIPTDFDIRSFVRGLKRQHSTYTWLAGALFDKKIRSFISPGMINRNRVCSIGFPVKKVFYEPYNKTELLKKLGIRSSQRIILLIMGSPALLRYCKALSNLKLDKIHILICLASSKYLAKSIHKITFAAGIQYSIVPQSISVAQAMHVADLCISKPGSVTFAETIYSNRVVLLDATSPLLVWENFNTTFVQKYGNGVVITHDAHICKLVERFFNDYQWRTTLINATNMIEKKDFSRYLSGLVLTILAMNTTSKAHSIQLTQRSV